MQITFLTFDNADNPDRQDNTRKSYNDLFPVWSIDLMTCHVMWGFRVGGGVHDSYTFQCGLVGYCTSPGIDTR